MTATMELEGFAELDAALAQLSRSAGKGVLRRALKKAGEPLVAIVRAGVPRDDGDLAESIAISTKLDKRQRGQHRKMFRSDKASVEMFIGPSYDLGDGGRHGHLVEFGTKPRINSGIFAGTTHPGTAPQPFMRPAWDSDKTAMLDRLKVDLWAELQKAIARADRKAAG
jgi:HK97 gp10 family phage protein